MALSKGRIHLGAGTEYPWEREAVDSVLAGLPDVDPYQAWELQELSDPSSGKLYELDLVVLGKHALYLIEIKSWPGEIRGDVRDWLWSHDGKASWRENPYPLTNKKAKVLKSLLERELAYDQRIWVEPLVYLSNPNLKVQLPPAALSHVVQGEHILRALTHGEYPGAQQRSVINRPLMKAVVQGLATIGIRPSRSKSLIGQFELGDLLGEGPDYQDHRAVHTSIATQKARVRSYLTPKATSKERKAQLERAAKREAAALTAIGEHPSILRCFDFVPNGRLGPALLFEPFEGASSLDQLVRVQPDLPFDDRLEIIRQLAEAVEYCHGRKVLHRLLSPQSVLVRRTDDGGLEVKLHSFQLSVREEGTSGGTLHLTAHTGDDQLVYQAPEVLQDPTKASELSDVFSLGAVAFFVLTGQPPAPSLPERERRLLESGALHVTAVRDDLTPKVDEVVALATEAHTTSRADSAIEWFNLLLEAATEPAVVEDAATIDPHGAGIGDRLGHDLEVVAELGSGSTARVLKVRRGAAELALKVPHDEGCAGRLRTEAEVLERLSHPAIVRSHGLLEVGGRLCLLLELAGDRTVAAELRREGSIGLDFARRFGDDLLSALQHLEEQGVQHRDIKPGNLGFSSEKKKRRHLKLFDFSLSSIPAGQVTAGTAAYRDPFLLARGAWDAAADRYAAAAALYEMLTGSRPEVREGGPGASFEVVVEAERLDAAVRDRMAAFFRRAFHPADSERFASAEAMKVEWLALFAEGVPEAERRETKPAREIGLDDPVEVLDLSNRARNALDRAGVATVRELLALPQNHLSAIRGVGTKVAREVLDRAAELRARLAAEAPPEPFLAGYAGRRVALGTGHGLDADALRTLRDAGLGTTTDLAAAPRQRVERLLGLDRARKVRAALAEPAPAPEGRTDLERWHDELFAPRSRRTSANERHVRALLGLDPLPGAEADDGPPPVHREAAAVGEAFAISRQRVYQSLANHRRRWLEAACLDEVLGAVNETLEARGGLADLAAAARELAQRHGAGPQPTDDELRLAGAVLRAVVELRSQLDDRTRVLIGRIAQRPWLATSPEALEALRGLADVAERLAAADELPSTDRVRQDLEAAAEGTPLAGRPYADLVRLAAAAAKSAAVSGRLELYPPGMAAERALRLSQSVLAVPELTPDEVLKRIRERYPEAQPLPGRPALDVLLAEFGLRFHELTGTYCRPGVDAPSLTGTVQQPTRLGSAAAGEPRLDTPEAREAARFHQELMAGIEGGRFRVIQVAADWAETAAGRLAEELGVEPTSLDHALWAQVEARMGRLGVSREAVLEADRQGPGGPHWPLLLKLVREAAADVVSALLADRTRPRVLVHPGAFARYGLADELHTLVEEAEHGEGAAVVLLVPAHEDGAPPSINGQLPVPAPIPGQRMRMPKPWIRNLHRAPGGAA